MILTSNVSELLGKTLTEIVISEDKEGVTLSVDDGTQYGMAHDQDCCESVQVEDVIGDLNDLIGSPILQAEEVINENDQGDESHTWTFYKFATIKGYVTIRWLGSSNGYYSESVQFFRV